jgi:hypothetical protein
MMQCGLVFLTQRALGSPQLVHLTQMPFRTASTELWIDMGICTATGRFMVEGIHGTLPEGGGFVVSGFMLTGSVVGVLKRNYLAVDDHLFVTRLYHKPGIGEPLQSMPSEVFGERPLGDFFAHNQHNGTFGLYTLMREMVTYELQIRWDDKAQWDQLVACALQRAKAASVVPSQRRAYRRSSSLV